MNVTVPVGLFAALLVHGMEVNGAMEKDPLDYVDPTIGTISSRINSGKMLPGPVTPFGMVQIGPDTITEGDHTSGYCYTHDRNALCIWAYIGKPWMVQKWTRNTLEKGFSTGPGGWAGNDDCGEISAWYILNAIGLHQANPAAPYYTITSPLFNEVTIGLDADYYPGGQFKIVAGNNSAENRYIQSARLNGKEINRFWITHTEITAGGMLELDMGPEPNKQWGTGSLPPQSELYKKTPAHPTPPPDMFTRRVNPTARKARLCWRNTTLICRISMTGLPVEHRSCQTDMFSPGRPQNSRFLNTMRTEILCGILIAEI